MKKLFATAAAATVLIAGTATAQIVLPSGQVGAPYSAALTTPSGYSTANYVTPSAPPGLSVAGATLVGTPSVAGTYNFTVDVSGMAASMCPSAVFPYNPVPCLLPASTKQTYSVQVAAAPAPVPTLSEWAMILLGVMLAGGAALTIQRRRAA
ncbi:IPTL-CTERM sorting domain-containing protein [Brevundimonas naejangsanensis]